MTKDRYTDPTTASDPPGGKHHDLRHEAGVPLLTDHDALGGKQSKGKSAASTKKVAKSEK